MSSGTRSTDSPANPHREVRAAIDVVWRIESPRLIAGLTRITRDIAAAEDLAHDALVAALDSGLARGSRRIPARG